VPGGETKVCLRFDRICAGGDDAFFLCFDESSSECALSCGDGGVEVGCKITPTPSLLAEPSRPIAIGMLTLVLDVVECSNPVPVPAPEELNFLFRNVTLRQKHVNIVTKPAGSEVESKLFQEAGRPSRDREFWEASTLPCPCFLAWLEELFDYDKIIIKLPVA